ncbi:MAG TPA: hypothetical protein VMF89_32655, partial [Polyangiales bacterium]|nr:hypothetical protein [Polyangiales bacterium]
MHEPLQPGIEVNVIERDGERVVGPYRHAVSFAAESRCDSGEGPSLVHTQSGQTARGRFVLHCPTGCAL